MDNTYIDPLLVQSVKVAVDAVCIATVAGKNYILLIKREYEPFKDCWAIPGGFLKEDEELEEGVLRELKEETNLNVDHIVDEPIQIGAYGAKNRDPRPRRVISIAYLVKLDERMKVSASNESLEVDWIDLSDINKINLAFDHKKIIEDALVILND